MKHLIQQIIDQIIKKNALINHYPKQDVTFLTLDSLFNDPLTRKLISDAVLIAVSDQGFDAVAGIASRGYLFSGMITGRLGDKGENLIQKVKVKGDKHYLQIDTQTEYSSDAVQVLKNSIIPGKRYLLTDDLIATGGSVMAAVKLIRQGGGLVDCAFVMTELVDFGAREKLRLEGVELISLLAFNKRDLEKMIVMQQCYEASPGAEMTYKLSHHSKGRSVDIKKLHIASKSKLKIQAAQLALQGMFDDGSEVFGHDVASGVSSQPFGYDETLQGAKNRLQAVISSVPMTNNEIFISIENGMRYSKEDNAYYDFVHVIVKHEGNLVSHSEDCCKVPVDIVKAMAKGANNEFLETWGEAAKRQGLAREANNPHQELCFGGISREQYLFQASCKALGKLKESMQDEKDEESQLISIKRLMLINSDVARKKYAKRSVFFGASPAIFSGQPLDLYNHGCPVTAWGIDADKVKRTDFKIFSTGDAFSVISPNVIIDHANINIHVGIDHQHYSPLALLQEALQLCRAAYEHGAGEITIALPEKFHPLLNLNDFNQLLISLFKASGANKIVYYGADYRGVLDQSTINAKISHQVQRHDINRFLPLFNSREKKEHDLNFDEQVMHFTRKKHLDKVMEKTVTGPINQTDDLFGQDAPSAIHIPTVNRLPHILICCRSNRNLAENISNQLRAHGETVKLYQIEGSGENARLPHDVTVCGATVTIVQSTRPSPDNLSAVKDYHINGASTYLFEAAMIARQAKLRGARKINLINPYQFSARSDKAEANPKGRTGAYVQHNGLLLKAAGVNQVVTAECHDCHTMSGSYTGKNMKGTALSALSLITKKIASKWLDDVNHSMQGQIRLVTPDAGATKRTNQLTEELQAILGDKLCRSRVLGEKSRNSHRDDSALINGFNTGDKDINADDKFIITDDETATGNTLCQAITNIKSQGAVNIDVIVVHNNMPLDLLQRQLCLARFLYLGVSDLHFSDTQEMGELASSYKELVCSYASTHKLDIDVVESEVADWFIKNISVHFDDQSLEHINHELSSFKHIFNEFQSRVHVHSLAHEFADKVSHHQSSASLLTLFKGAPVSELVNINEYRQSTSCGF